MPDARWSSSIRRGGIQLSIERGAQVDAEGDADGLTCLKYAGLEGNLVALQVEKDGTLLMPLVARLIWHFEKKISYESGIHIQYEFNGILTTGTRSRLFHEPYERPLIALFFLR